MNEFGSANHDGSLTLLTDATDVSVTSVARDRRRGVVSLSGVLAVRPGRSTPETLMSDSSRKVNSGNGRSTASPASGRERRNRLRPPNPSRLSWPRSSNPNRGGWSGISGESSGATGRSGTRRVPPGIDSVRLVPGISTSAPSGERTENLPTLSLPRSGTSV